jgi:outer membrane immunogenic protein
MFLRRALAALCAIACVALSAAGAKAQVFNTGPWTGLYLGAHGGYGWSRDASPDTDGWVGGLQVGYNLQLGQVVVGVEGDYTWGDLNGSSTVTSLPLTGSVESMWSIRARLGVTLSNSVLLYGTAGYGGFDVSARTLISGVTFRADSSYDAFVLGAGAELLLTRSIVLRMEGLHYIGDGKLSLGSLPSTSDGDVTVLRAGVSYKF